MTATGTAAETVGRPSVFDELRRLVPNGLIATDPPVVDAHVPADRLAHVVHALAERGDARLADLFADDGDRVTLHMVWALDSDQCYLITRTPIADHTYPSLSEIAPAVFCEECEIYEQFGARPSGGIVLNRVAVPPHAGDEFPRLGHGAPRLDQVHAPHAVGGQAFEFPNGPVRAAGAESLYYGLVTSGEEVIDLYLFTWHKHRGAEWRARGRTPAEALFHIERLEGLGSVGTTLAYCRAVEAATDIHVPAGAARIRAIALELERLYNHAAALAALCQSTGLSVGQAAAEIAFEQFLRLNAAAFGHRYLFNVLDIGGARRAPQTAALLAGLPQAYAELRRTIDALMGTNSFLDRLESTGIVTEENARRLALVGPVARGSGISVDVRRDHPYPPFDDLRIAVPVGSSGDCLHRLQVMLAEAAASVEIITALLSEESAPSVAAVPLVGGIGLGWAESARGEALAWVRLGEDGRIQRLRLRPAAVRNWRAFDDAARSQNVFTDIPIIEASFWLTVAGTAR